MNFIDLQGQYRRIEDQVNSRIRAVLEHGRYVNGPELAELEQRLAEYTGTAYCVGVSSGTDALLIALMALGVGAGDEVITTPFTFIATGETILLAGAEPVFVDIDPRTYNLDPDKLEEAISDKTKAIMPVSLYGQCADMDAINGVARRHGIPVIEDGAQSFGALYKERRSCSLSTIGCTSFFPSKPLGAYGDGGACFTDDEGLAKSMREIREHGQDRRYHHPRLGLNGRLDTIQAAVLLAKLDLFDDEVAARARVGDRYSRLLADAGCVTPFIELYNTSVYAQYTLQVSNRDAVLARLADAGIPTAVHYPVPLSRQPVFLAAGFRSIDLSVAERLSDRVFSLPMHPYLSEEDQDKVAAAVIAAVAES